MAWVKDILEAAQKRLAVVSREASLVEAAQAVANPNTPLAVVCDSDRIVVGVIAPSHIVKALASTGTAASDLSAGAIMTEPVLTCHIDDPLQQVWSIMNSRTLPCAPILDQDGRPQGIIHARDVAMVLLEEVNYEEGLLRDYVMGVGYE
jgi:CBS domain-containing protein